MLGLKELLQRFAPERLAQLRQRLKLGSPYGSAAVPAVAAQIAHALEHPQRLQPLIGRLDQAEERLFRHLVSHGGQARSEELATLVPDASAVITRLRERWLIFDDPLLKQKVGWELWCVPREYARYLRLTPAEEWTLGALLDRQPSGYHSRLATMLALNRDTGSKGYLIDQARDIVLNPARVKRLIARLPEQAQQLLGLGVRANGVLEIAQLQAPPPKTRRTWPEARYAPLPDPAQQLYLHGLLFPDEPSAPAFLVVPSDLLPLLRDQSAPAPAPSPDSPGTVRSWGVRLVSDAYLFAAYLASGRLRTTQSGAPQKKSVARFLEAVGCQQEERYGLFLYALLGAELGCAGRQAKGSPPGSSFAASIVTDPSGVLRTLLERWVESMAWQESLVGQGPGGRVRSSWPDESLPAKRLLLLRALERLPACQWVLAQELMTQLRELGWGWIGVQERRRAYAYDPWLADRALPSGSSEAETLGALLNESLVWLGLVDVGLSPGPKRQMHVSHVRLTEWGRWALEKRAGAYAELAPIQEEERFSVLPSLEIAVPPRLQFDLLVQVFQLAELRGPSSFAVTKDSVRQALDEGFEMASISKFLQAHSRTGVPESIQQFLRELGQKYGHIKLGFAGAYLEVSDPLLLVELASHKAVKLLIHKCVGSHVAFLTEEPKKVATLLKKLGYLPVVDEDDGRPEQAIGYRRMGGWRPRWR